LVTANPLRNIGRPSIPDNPPPVVTLPQMQALLRTCAGTSFADRRDTAILSLFYDTGIRRAEMAGITQDDLDLQARTVTVTGKGSRRRTVRYGADMARTLDRYLRERAKSHYRDSPALWLGERGSMGAHGIEQVVQRRTRAAGLTHIHCHTFRHAATHHLLSSGYSEGDVMQQMGWKSRQMADRYGRAVAGERARANFDPHSPLSKLRRS
jgi:site-specific recombinase XerD